MEIGSQPGIGGRRHGVHRAPARSALWSAPTAIQSRPVPGCSRSSVTMKTVGPRVGCKVAISVSSSSAPDQIWPRIGSSRDTICGWSTGARTLATHRVMPLIIPPDPSPVCSHGARPFPASATTSSSSSCYDSFEISRFGNCRFSRAVAMPTARPAVTARRRSIVSAFRVEAGRGSTPSTLMVPARFGSRPIMVRMAPTCGAGTADEAEDLRHGRRRDRHDRARCDRRSRLPHRAPRSARLCRRCFYFPLRHRSHPYRGGKVANKPSSTITRKIELPRSRRSYSETDNSNKPLHRHPFPRGHNVDNEPAMNSTS